MIQQNNGFTNSEMVMIRYYKYFTDDIVTYINYLGDSVKITVEDPDTYNLTDFDFGAPILRESTMIYANGGYYHTYGDDPSNPRSILYKDARYEGVRSFAIVTTHVTDEILQYWLDQKDKTGSNGTLLYANGPMKAAYGTFLSSLIMIKCHDMIADQAANQYNVTWTRTTPIIVSVFDDAYLTIMTLECDHRFGMDIIGASQNITAFRYACSSAINPLEHYVMKTLFPDVNGTSIVIGIGEEIFNGQMPGIFLSNGYLVFKSSVNNMFLIFDPTTGILRDVMYLNGTVSGAGCFSDLQTEWIHELGEKLKSSNLSAQLEWLNSTIQIGMFAGTVLGSCLADVAVVGGMTIGAVALSVALPVLGVFVACYIFDYCVDQGWLPPERCREILGILPPFAIVNKLVYNEEPLFELTKQGKQSAITTGSVLKKDLDVYRASLGQIDGPKGDKAAFLRNLYNKSVGWIKEGVSDISAARYATGTAKITLSASGVAKIIVGTGGIEFWGTYFAMELFPQAKKQILKLIS